MKQTKELADEIEIQSNVWTGPFLNKLEDTENNNWKIKSILLD